MTARPARIDDGLLAVRAAAAAVANPEDLHRRASACTACPDLVAGRVSVVVGSGPVPAALLLVGEAPGAAEDRTGLPFVGPAGQLLDALLTEVGLARESVAVANVLQCRPPGNRPPRRSEVARCRHWLDRRLALVRPRVVCTLGGTATGWALGSGARVTELRGRVYAALGRLVVPTYHPSAALRFGPAGAPWTALRADLATVARLLDRNHLDPDLFDPDPPDAGLLDRDRLDRDPLDRNRAADG